MKKLLCMFLLLLALTCTFAACDTAICQHRDKNDDALCDKCQESYTDGTDVTKEDESDPQVLYARAQKLGYEGTLEEFLALCKGADGVSIINTRIDENGNLLIYYSNAPTTAINLGKVIGATGATGETGKDGVGIQDVNVTKDGELVLIYTDNTVENLGTIVGANGATGVGIASTAMDKDGNLVVTYTDGTSAVLAHDWEYSYTLREATCKQTGMDLYTCKDCSLVRMVMPPITDHSGGEWIVDIAPTWKTEGLKHIECVGCGLHLEEEVLPCLPVAPYKLGMGVVVSLDSSKSGLAQVDATIASVVLDEDGRIVSCRIDAIQNKVSLSLEGDGAYSALRVFQTKVEMGDNYGMSNFGMDFNKDGIVLEWYKQAQAFESWAVGKTAQDIEMTATQEVMGHQIAVDSDLLDAGCTIQITEIKAAVLKACKDDQTVEFEAGAFRHGLAAVSYVDTSSYFATSDNDGKVNIYSDIACSVVDEDGKILASLMDAIQPRIEYNVDGEITNKSYTATKRELKENYGMKHWGIDNNADGIVYEWYIQSSIFTKYVSGFTIDQVTSMPTKTSNGHIISADDDLLSAGCTIQITEIKAIVAKAAKAAR